MTLLDRIRPYYQWSSLINVLFVLSLIVIGIVWLTPPVGSHSPSAIVPVQVFVFDPHTNLPINGARVAIFQGENVAEGNAFRDGMKLPAARPAQTDIKSGVTAADGAVVIKFRVPVGQPKHERDRLTYVSAIWIKVEADDFGGVVIPLRDRPIPLKKLQEQKELFAPIGLLPLSEVAPQ